MSVLKSCFSVVSGLHLQAHLSCPLCGNRIHEELLTTSASHLLIGPSRHAMIAASVLVVMAVCSYHTWP